MSFSSKDLRALFDDLAQVMVQQRDHLCALDAEIGDADHGIAMRQGMAAATSAVAELPETATFQEMFNAAAKGFLNAVGASSGPLYATAFMWAGKRMGPVTTVPNDDLRHVVVAISEGIAHRGKATPGQKTMLDAWQPAARVAAEGKTAAEITAAALQGAEATKAMTASLGRAARLGERSLGHPDPGAISAAIIVERICHYQSLDPNSEK